MMSEKQFDAEMERIEADYAARREGADARRDQEVARLFAECRWTQEKIAERMGKSQKWVDNRLRFGRFLSISTSGTNHELPPNLTERAFRAYWSRTPKLGLKDSEEDRFGRVLELMRAEPPAPPPSGKFGNLARKPGIRAAVVEAISSGRRMETAEIVEAVREKLPDVAIDSKQITAALQALGKQPPKGLALDARHSGRSHKYRLVHRKGPAHAPLDPERAGRLAAEVLPKVKYALELLRRDKAERSVTGAIHELWGVCKALEALSAPEGEVVA